MKRPLLILLAALSLGAMIFAGAYFASRRTCEMCQAKPADNLAWLQMEFHLSDTEMARIRTLHESYLPQCAALCNRIAAQQDELDRLPATGTYAGSAAQAISNEIVRLRAQCQAQMLQHFVMVSQAMPPEAGRRYLAKMRELTLGTNLPMEQAMPSMPGAASHDHHP